MKTLGRPKAKQDTFKLRNGNLLLAQKVNNEETLIDFKFYQKLFLVLTVLSTILIFPESPKESEIICNFYHSQRICKVW
tara:strand:- start:359 stop:595 length:237 start_codon:yes stop_codon:yes gene_type:complete